MTCPLVCWSLHLQGSPVHARLHDMAEHCHVSASTTPGSWQLDPMSPHLDQLALGLRACRFKSKRVFQGSVLVGNVSHVMCG